MSRSRKKLPISVVIITFNEEKNLPRLLANLKIFSEILVLDSFSNDGTQKIASSSGARILSHEFQNHVEQKNYAIKQAKNDWVLSLDADERLSIAGIKEIKRQFKKAGKYVGFRFPRKTCYLGRWISSSGWYPNWQLRLFDRRAGEFQGEKIHESVVLKGAVKNMKNPIEHYSFSSFKEHLQTSGKYAKISAAEMYKKGRFFYFFLISVRPFLSFFRDFFLLRGFKDFLAGYIICVIRAFSVFYKYVLLFELRCKKDTL
ncbi:glycosyltransferase family 2 protein [Candidatus Riflebacteria bacterium]